MATKEELEKWLADIHSFVGRGKHNSAEENYKCSISGAINIKESLRELEEQNTKLLKLLEDTKSLISKAAPLAWVANGFAVQESAYEWKKKLKNY